MANILVVDDELGIRDLLSEILNDEGHNVELAENASQARAARNRARPDLVLLDIWMPDTDGISLLKEWASGGQLTMPVIMMSGHGTIDSAVEATRIGAMDFLEKPIALAKLLSAVKRALARGASPEQRPSAPSLSAVGRSGALRDLRRKIEQMAARSRVVLLRCGPSSFGELAARTLAAPGRRWLELATISGAITQEQLDAARGGVIHTGDIAHLSRMQQKNLAFALERLDRLDARLIACCAQGAPELQAAGWEEAVLARLDTAPVARTAWQDYGELHLCDSDEEALQVAERLCSEHVQVMTRDPDWYLQRMTRYGALFLGHRTNVSYGDKVIGTNHTLPTQGAGRYTGYHVELCERVIAGLREAQRLPALAIDYQPVTSSNRIPLVRNGTVDLECGTTTNNAARQKEVAFALTTYVTEVRLAVAAKSAGGVSAPLRRPRPGGSLRGPRSPNREVSMTHSSGRGRSPGGASRARAPRPRRTGNFPFRWCEGSVGRRGTPVRRDRTSGRAQAASGAPALGPDQAVLKKRLGGAPTARRTMALKALGLA